MPVIFMETAHLHRTIRLVWNTFMPEALHLGTLKTTVFSNLDIYSPEYLVEVVSAMYNELLNNRDEELKDWMLEELDHMQLKALLAAIPVYFESHLEYNNDE